MEARRLSPAEFAARSPAELTGTVLLAPVRLAGRMLPKGARLDGETVAALRDAARSGALASDVRLAWPGADDLHEDVAATLLAEAVGGPGVRATAPRQSRIDLRATSDGVLHVRVTALARLNAIDPLEVFTLFHGQAVTADEVIAAVKVAPHLVPRAVVAEGVRAARATGPLLEVRPYRGGEVAAIVAERMTPDALQRFEDGAARKVGALGSTFIGTTHLPDGPPDLVERSARAALDSAARTVPVVLVGGVSAGDPLAPFFAALASLGGALLRRGVPAHPGSMIWLARLGDTQLLGLPQCGMFSLATAADLILPRMLTGEHLDAAAIADLGHGGLLGREMRFRMPAYARDLAGPNDP
jgi:molybdenum cofactor cytidylyltransferase